MTDKETEIVIINNATNAVVYKGELKNYAPLWVSEDQLLDWCKNTCESMGYEIFKKV